MALMDAFLFTLFSFKMWLLQALIKEVKRNSAEYIEDFSTMNCWYSMDIRHFKDKNVLHCRLIMLILPWQGKLLSPEPAVLVPVLAISIWLVCYLPAGLARRAHWSACGILNVLLGLRHHQERFLLLAISVRNPPGVNTTQSKCFFGVSQVRVENPRKEIFGNRYFRTPVWLWSGRNCYDRELSEDD